MQIDTNCFICKGECELLIHINSKAYCSKDCFEKGGERICLS